MKSIKGKPFPNQQFLWNKKSLAHFTGQFADVCQSGLCVLCACVFGPVMRFLNCRDFIPFLPFLPFLSFHRTLAPIAIIHTLELSGVTLAQAQVNNTVTLSHRSHRSHTVRDELGLKSPWVTIGATIKLYNNVNMILK